VVLLVLLGGGCQQEPPAAGIGQIVLSRAVGPNQNPIGETDMFAPTSVVYCSVWLSALPAGTVLTAHWYYEDQLIESGTTSYTIGQTEWSETQEAIGYVTFRFEPRSPLPEGSYRVEISLNGKVVQRLPFQVRE
jgi:hypothetical protein